MFVTKIDPNTNTVVLGEQEDLESSEAWVRDFNLIKYDNLHHSIEAVSKIRYKDQGMMSTVTQMNDHLKIDFHHKVAGIAPGQSAVFYEGNDLLGGGFLI